MTILVPDSRLIIGAAFRGRAMMLASRLLLVFVLLSTSGFSQQQSGTAAASATTIKISTRLVQIELVAIDKHGKAILDLKPEEIQVLERGHPQKLATFEYHHTETSPSVVPSLPLGVYGNRQL